MEDDTEAGPMQKRQQLGAQAPGTEGKIHDAPLEGTAGAA